MQEKETTLSSGCSVRIENSVTRDNCSASLVMSNSYPGDGIFNPHFETIKDSYIPSPFSKCLLI